MYTVPYLSQVFPYVNWKDKNAKGYWGLFSLAISSPFSLSLPLQLISHFEKELSPLSGLLSRREFWGPRAGGVIF